MNTEGPHNYVVVKNIPLRNKFKEREKKIIEKNIMSSYKQCICIEKVMKGINTLLEDVAEWISLFNLNFDGSIINRLISQNPCLDPLHLKQKRVEWRTLRKSLRHRLRQTQLLVANHVDALSKLCAQDVYLNTLKYIRSVLNVDDLHHFIVNVRYKYPFQIEHCIQFKDGPQGITFL